MELTFNPIGAPAYGTAFRSYIATIPLKDLGAEDNTLPLFVIPKGSTIVAVKLVCTEDSNGAGSIDIGTYKITNGAVGTAVDADALYAASAYAVTTYDNYGKPTGGTYVGTLLNKAATATNTQMSEDVVIQVSAKTVTEGSVPTKGALQLEVVTL